MNEAAALVSIGLPVRNGGERVSRVIRSVLAQDHEYLELVICDNASEDDTREVCEDLARGDQRIKYHRQAENVGLLRNFVAAICLAKGDYFRWIGDDDWLGPTYVSRSLEAFAADKRRIVVTTQLTYSSPDGTTTSDPNYDGVRLGSPDPMERLNEMLRLLNESPLMVDPLYALVRRGPISCIPRRNILREDEVFAVKMALAGPWGHVPEILAGRSIDHQKSSVVAKRLGVPVWQAHISSTLESLEILRWLNHSGLDGRQRRQAQFAIGRMYMRRQARTYAHRVRRLKLIASSAVRGSRSLNSRATG